MVDAYFYTNVTLCTLYCRKKVGNFIAGTDESQQRQQSAQDAAKKGKHTPLPVDPYPYPGKRFSFHFITVDVTTVGRSE